MHRHVLPLGSLAPWVLVGCAVLLAVIGWLTGNREMFILAGVAVLAFVVAFPLARLLMGKHEDSPD